MTIEAYVAHAGDKPLEPLEITPRSVSAHDVQIDIAYCDVCHSDLHQVRAEWAVAQFPRMPGHEIVGRVAAVGEHVRRFKLGDRVGIVGIGGPGHMGIELAHAIGAQVAFTTSEPKRAVARALGAEVVMSRNVEEMASHVR